MATDVYRAAVQHMVLDTTGMVYERLLGYYENTCKQDKEQRQIIAKRNLSSQPRSLKNRQFQGDIRVQRIRHYLEYGFKDDQGKRIIRSKEQRELHEVYIRSCLPKIYQYEWEDNQERILHKFGLTKLQQEALVIMPRRAGKTWSMAMFIATMLLVCSDIEISVFATGQRTAGKLLKIVSKFLKHVMEYAGGDDYKMLHQNQENITILGPDKTERVCGCYPGSVAVSFFSSLVVVVVVVVVVQVITKKCFVYSVTTLSRSMPSNP